MHVEATTITVTIQTFKILDIDECRQGTHQCSQDCHNSYGSYVCTCGSGFLINGKTCIGEYIHTCMR